jgi:GNAT superfamily N-acetyltransferase
MQAERTHTSVSSACEGILRSLPKWFGIEQALLQYAADADVYPTFVVRDGGRMIAFATVRKHFDQAYEVHCIAVRAGERRRGCGIALLTAAESWARHEGGRFIQVKTLAANHPSPEYADTRSFYERAGYVPLEVFPELWSKSNPCLQLVKALEV